VISDAASERNYQLLFDANPSPMWVFANDTRRFLAVNEAAVAGYGYSRAEFLAMTIDDIRPADDLAALHAHIENRPGEDTRPINGAGIWRHVRKDGTVAQVEVSSHAHEFDGVPSRVVLAVDISERLSAEVALRESEARYRDLFENATDLIATADLHGVLTNVNRAFVETLGYSRAELIGKPLSELVPAESHEQMRRARADKLSTISAATVYEHPLVAKDGHHVHVEVATRLIQIDGRPVGVEAICRNISERRSLEEQLQQTQKMEAVGQLAGGIAHDFNNLLTAITGYASLLEPSLAGDAPALSKLEVIIKTADRATELTRQLLMFSRKQIVQLTVLDLNAVVRETEQILERLMGEGVSVTMRLDPEIDGVSADGAQLSQVLLNLVLNARDAMPDGGTVLVATENVSLDATTAATHGALPGDYVVLSVTDTGCGMDATTKRRLFEPFFTTKEKGKGTGLGLSTLYGVVESTGGFVVVDTELVFGSTMRVLLPSSSVAPEVAAVIPGGDSADTSPQRVLVVEDDPVVRDVTVALLERQGHRVVVADSSVHAIELFDADPAAIDLLVTDVVMPQLNGWELAECLRAQRAELPIVFMSGYTDGAIGGASLDEGMTFMPKPFSATDLATAMRHALKSRPRTAA
jgi:two-component system, cell cycle sensor histidine kinase and response regulator CckA